MSTFRHPRPFPFAVPMKTQAEIIALATDFFGAGEGINPRIKGTVDQLRQMFWKLQSVSSQIDGFSSVPALVINEEIAANISTDNAINPVGAASDVSRILDTSLFVNWRGSDNAIVFKLELPASGFVFNTTTGQMESIFRVTAAVGEAVAVSAAEVYDAITGTSIDFGGDLDLFATFGAGPESGETVSLSAIIFNYAP